MMRIRQLPGLGERGFSFDLVSRRRSAPETVAETAALTEIETAAETVTEIETVAETVAETAAVTEIETAAETETEAADAAEPVSEDPVASSDLLILRRVSSVGAPAAAPAAKPAPAAVAPLRLEPAARAEPEPAAAPEPARRTSRVKTTFLGFDRSGARSSEVFARGEEARPSAGRTEFPFGWVVIIKGPGRGTAFTLQGGVSQIGRGEDQAIQLDFGDTAISRANHAAIAFDEEERKFYLGHGGKANIVRLNGKPVLSTELLQDGDLIRIGETTMAFVAFCSEDFAWNEE